MRGSRSADTRDPRSETFTANDAFDAFAIAAPGLAPLVARELAAQGIAPREISDAGVAFDANAAALFQANLTSRVASRIVVRLASFVARDFAALERGSAKIAWRDLFDPRANPPERALVRVTCRKSRLYHSDAVAERVGRAISVAMPSVVVSKTVDDDIIDADVRDSRVASDAAHRDAADAPVHPTPQDERITQRIIVRIDHDRCTISADSSGALLHRRGWRHAVAKAPLRETLAAAMLAGCEWHPHEALVDPFCGSGTIGIEAALASRGVAPGLGRSFRMERWMSVSPRMLRESRERARGSDVGAVAAPILLADRDEGAVAAARANAERAGVADDLTIAHRSLSETRLADVAAEGLVLVNPPYGIRVSEADALRPLYARLGEIVRDGGSGWRIGMLVNDARFARHTGLRMREILRTSNGGIPVSLMVSGVPSAARRE